jgi:hypothetical protein
MATFCLIDDKHVPLHRIMWISAVPHFCGSPECQHEGDYEIRLEQGESVWANQAERDMTLAAVDAWESQPGLDEEELE